MMCCVLMEVYRGEFYPLSILSIHFFLSLGDVADPSMHQARGVLSWTGCYSQTSIHLVASQSQG